MFDAVRNDVKTEIRKHASSGELTDTVIANAKELKNNAMKSKG